MIIKGSYWPLISRDKLTAELGIIFNFNSYFITYFYQNILSIILFYQNMTIQDKIILMTTQNIFLWNQIATKFNFIWMKLFSSIWEWSMSFSQFILNALLLYISLCQIFLLQLHSNVALLIGNTKKNDRICTVVSFQEKYFSLFMNIYFIIIIFFA